MTAKVAGVAIKQDTVTMPPATFGVIETRTLSPQLRGPQLQGPQLRGPAS